MSDEHKTTDPDWKTQYPEAANMDWLNEGVWLKRARPSYHPLSFSPDGRWIIGGTSKAFLWDTRTGEVRAHWGKTFTLKRFMNFEGVSFISNQENRVNSRAWSNGFRSKTLARRLATKTSLLPLYWKLWPYIKAGNMDLLLRYLRSESCQKSLKGRTTAPVLGLQKCEVYSRFASLFACTSVF